MAQQKIRLGYIGAGAYSRRVLLPNFQKIPGVELTVIANSSQESSEAVAQAFGFARYAANWREVVAETTWMQSSSARAPKRTSR